MSKRTLIKLLLKTGAIAAILCAGARVTAYIVDNRASDPRKMVERYTTESGEHFFRINAGVNNAYLLPVHEGWLLVDTGYPDDYGRFKTALASAGIDRESIRFLFITHSHDEHAGFAAELKKDTGCRLIVPEDAVENLQAGLMVWNGSAVNRRIAVAAELYNLVKKRDFRFPPVSIGHI